ncbi:hypothetical protein HMPREF6745_0944 [Prevotella sp. oral taxon 472 str. F0295]|jgi:hypothetical protein|nr:hypothetical protein HMPREF6745_0944 [Prevotella sp. oral taxon 472 str. F0295]
MMTLIVVSGSRHTDWVFVEDGKIVEKARTEGLNPYFQTRKEISRSVRLGLPEEYFHRKLQKIYYYGAGCSNESKKKVVSTSIISQFKTPTFVESDLLAAARGMCLDKPGIACILDTGSNSCFYNGEEIEKNVHPGGFILGDEGSGSAMGKAFLSDVLKRLAPEELVVDFLYKNNTTPSEMMEKVYNEPLPHYYLATVSTFLAERPNHPYVHDLVADSFRSFVRRNLIQYDFQSQPVYFMGKIATTWEYLLREVCSEFNFEPACIENDIIPGLVNYHNRRKKKTTGVRT